MTTRECWSATVCRFHIIGRPTGIWEFVTLPVQEESINWRSGTGRLLRAAIVKCCLPIDVLRFGAGRASHVFQHACLWPFGFDNRWGKKGEHRAQLTLNDKSLFLKLNVKGRAWVKLNWNSRSQAGGVAWKVLGWDKDIQAYAVYVSYLRHGAPDSPLHPPYPESIDGKDILMMNNLQDPNEAVPDRLVAGSMYLLMTCGGQKPDINSKDGWTWSQTSGLLFQITAGVTYQEAVEALRLAGAAYPGMVKRSLKRCRSVLSRCATVRMPGHVNIETMGKTLPVLLDSLKLDDHGNIRFQPEGRYLDSQVSLETMRSLLYTGDYDFVDRFISFLSDPVRRGPQGQMAVNWYYDWTPDQCFLDWHYVDLAYLALIGHLQWHARDDRVLRNHYKTGREFLLRILKETDAGTGLFRSRGLWPDNPLRGVGRKGRPWPAQEAGVWYEALRNWELLAMKRRDLRLAARIATAARKVKTSMLSLFYEPATGFFADSVDPGSRRRHPHYASYAVYFLYGIFGHELTDGATIRRMADVAYAELYDPSWKAFRTTLRKGPFHSPHEFVSTPFLDLVMARLFRLARHREGLRALRDAYEFHYGKFYNHPEVFNLMPDAATINIHSRLGWFNFSLATKYQVILECLYGIHLTPYNMGIFPVGWDQPMRLENLAVGKSRWSFNYQGTGDWPAGIRLDGKNWPGSWCFPGRLLEHGQHTVDVVMGERMPPHPVLLEAAGLELVDARVKGTTLITQVKGPGRAYLRFFCRSKPAIRIKSKAMKFDWDAAARHAVFEVTAKDRQKTEIIVD